MPRPKKLPLLDVHTQIYLAGQSGKLSGPGYDIGALKAAGLVLPDSTSPIGVKPSTPAKQYPRPSTTDTPRPPSVSGITTPKIEADTSKLTVIQAASGITIGITPDELQSIADAKAKGQCVGAMKAFYTVKTYKVKLKDGTFIYAEALSNKTAKQKAKDAGYNVAWATKVSAGEVPATAIPTPSAAQIVVEREVKEGSIKLDSGEWVSKDAYDTLPQESQAQLNKLGTDGYNQWVVDEAGRQISTSESRYLIDAFESGGLKGYNKAVEEYNQALRDANWLALYNSYKQNADKEWGKDNWDWFQKTYGDKLKDTKYMEYVQGPEFQKQYATVFQPASIPDKEYALIKDYITPAGFDSSDAFDAGKDSPSRAAQIIAATNQFLLLTASDETKAKLNSGTWTLLPYGQIIETEKLEQMPPTYRQIVATSGLCGYEDYQEKVHEWNKTEHWAWNTIDAIGAQAVRLGQDIKNFAILQLSASFPEVKEGDRKPNLPLLDPLAPGVLGGALGFTPPWVVRTYTAEEADEINAGRAEAQKYYKSLYDEAEMAAQEWSASRPYLQPVYPEGFVDSVKKDPSALKDPLLWGETIANTLPYTVATGLIVAGSVGAGPAGVAATGPLAFAITLSVEGHDIYKDAIANGASHDRALELANTYGSISAAIETLGDTIFVGALGFAGGAFSQSLGKNVGGNIVRGAAKKYGWKNLTVGMIKDFVNQGGQEFFQEVVHNAAIKTVNQNQALLENTANAFVSGVIGTAPFVLLPAGGQAIKGIRSAKVGDVRTGKPGTQGLTPIDITPQMQFKILNKVFAPVSGFTVQTKTVVAEQLKGTPAQIEAQKQQYKEGKGKKIYEAGKSIEVGLIDKKTVITDESLVGGQVIPAAERGRLAGSLEREAKGLRKIADGIIDEIDEINRKPNKTKADLDRKAKLQTKLNGLQAKISQLRQAISDIDSGIVTPLVARFYPKLAKSKVDETALAYAEMCAKVNEYAHIELQLKQAQKAIADFGLAKSKSQLETLNEYKKRAAELEGKLKELKEPMVEAVQKFSDTFLKNSVGLEAEQKAEVREMAKTIVMDIDSVTSQLFGERNAKEIAKDIKELEGQIKVIEDEMSKGMTREQLEGYARLISILKGQVGDLVNEMRLRYLAEGEKIKPDTKKLAMEVMSLQARLVKAVENLNNFAGSALNYDVYRKGELAHHAEILKLERDTFEAVQKTTEAIWGKEQYANKLAGLNTALSNLVAIMKEANISHHRVTGISFNIYDAIRGKQKLKALKKHIQALQSEAGKVKDISLRQQAEAQVGTVETLAKDLARESGTELQPERAKERTGITVTKEEIEAAVQQHRLEYTDADFEAARDEQIRSEAEGIVSYRLSKLMEHCPYYVRELAKRGQTEKMMEGLRELYDAEYFKTVHDGIFKDLDDYLSVENEEARIRMQVEHQEWLQKMEQQTASFEAEADLAKDLRDEESGPKRRDTLDKHRDKSKQRADELMRELKQKRKTRVAVAEREEMLSTAEREKLEEIRDKIIQERLQRLKDKLRSEAKAQKLIEAATKELTKEEVKDEPKEKESAFPGIRPRTKPEAPWAYPDVEQALARYHTLAGTKTKVFPKTAVEHAIEAGVQTRTATQTQTQTRTRTKTQTATQLQTQTQTAVQTAIQTAVQTSLETQTETATKEEIKTVTRVITGILTQTRTRQKPIILRRPKSEPIKRKQKIRREGPALATWKQGLYWVSVFPPFRTTGTKPDVVYSRQKPPWGSVIAKGRHAPRKTLRSIGRVPPMIEVPMGVVTARIKHGRKLSFSRRSRRKKRILD